MGDDWLTIIVLGASPLWLWWIAETLFPTRRK
jgi:hypothetical protein